jgi:hypothetical protein
MLQQGMVVKKQCYGTLGPFDESLSRAVDFDMNLRLCRSFKGIRINKPTFIIRYHDGLRGPAYDRHTDADRNKKWWAYDRKVFRKLYETTSIESFFEKESSGQNANDRKALAFLLRARVMSKWNLGDLVMKDLRSLQTLVKEKSVELTEEILRNIIIIEAICYRKGSERLSCSVHNVLLNLLCSSGKKNHLRKYVAQHYYWKGIEDFKQGQRKEFLRGILKAMSLMYITSYRCRLN